MNANAVGAVGVLSGESSVSIAGSGWFALRVVQSSKDPNAVDLDEGPSVDREDQMHPREADIEGFQFL